MTRYTHRSVAALERASYRHRDERFRVNVYFNGSQFDRLMEVAKSHEASLSTVVRELVEDGLAAREIGR